MSTAQQHIGIESLDIVPIVVSDLDDAIDFYTDILGFQLRMDETFEMGEDTGRWVTVAVPGDDLQLGLMPADEPYYDEESREALGAKLGSPTWYTFRTDDCAASVEALGAAGVEITRQPQEYPWGTEAMFADPDRNQFAVMEYAAE